MILIGDYEAVKSLVEAGENVNIKSKGLTPLMFAARHSRVKITRLLIAHGAKVDVRSDKRGLTALDFAKRANARDIVNIINNVFDKKN